MGDINTTVLVGRLTRDMELRYTGTGTAIGKFSVAVNRRRKQGEQWVDEANFFDVELWGRQAEAIQQYMQKGKQIAVSGELRQNRWTDTATGGNRSKVVIHAITVQLLGGGQQQGSQGQTGSNGAGIDDGDIPY